MPRAQVLSRFCTVFLTFICLLPSGRGAPAGNERAVHFRESRGIHRFLLFTNQLPQRDKEEWIQARTEHSEQPFELGSRVVFQIEEGTDLQALIKPHNLVLSRTVTPTLVILQAASSDAAIAAAEALSNEAGVIACYPIMRPAVSSSERIYCCTQ